MITFVRRRHKTRPVILVEKTDRLHRNLKDWVTIDELKVDLHLVKEGAVISAQLGAHRVPEPVRGRQELPGAR